LPADDLARPINQAHAGQGRHALAAAAFPHNAERLTLIQIQRDILHGFHHAAAGEEMGAQILYFKQPLSHAFLDFALSATQIR
jgi:hypothetical protein